MISKLKAGKRYLIDGEGPYRFIGRLKWNPKIKFWNIKKKNHRYLEAQCSNHITETKNDSSNGYL